MASSETENKSDYRVFLFYASWHQHSFNLVPVFDELEQTFPGIDFQKIDVDADEKNTQKFQIENVPALVVMEPGRKAVKVESNISASQIVQLVKAISIPKGGNEAQLAQKKKHNLETRMQALIDSAPLMIFMKGAREGPKCKFSKKLMNLLQQNSITEFQTFNILEDEEVRQGLKTYSNWKTYPQVYMKGELMGGVDIVEELLDAEEFQEQYQQALQNGGEESSAAAMESLESKLKRLINQDNIMLFMKGTPDNPRCGFSNTIVGLLKNTTGNAFGSFDILSDENVRQGLKTYSNWPTFPQLYVKGELIGGLDICQELAEEEELKDILEA